MKKILAISFFFFFLELKKYTYILAYISNYLSPVGVQFRNCGASKQPRANFQCKIGFEAWPGHILIEQRRRIEGDRDIKKGTE